MKKKILFLLFAVPLLGIALYTANYFTVASSEAFQFVERKIRNSSELREEIGEIKIVRLSPIGSFRLKHAGSNEWAFMVVDVIGANKSIQVDVNVKKIQGTWYLENAKTDSKELTKF